MTYFRPGFGGLAVGLVIGGERVEDDGRQFERDVESQKLGRRDHQHHADRREENQAVVLAAVARGSDRRCRPRRRW